MDDDVALCDFEGSTAEVIADVGSNNSSEKNEIIDDFLGGKINNDNREITASAVLPGPSVGVDLFKDMISTPAATAQDDDFGNFAGVSESICLGTAAVPPLESPSVVEEPDDFGAFGAFEDSKPTDLLASSSEKNGLDNDSNAISKKDLVLEDDLGNFDKPFATDVFGDFEQSDITKETLTVTSAQPGDPHSQNGTFSLDQLNTDDDEFGIFSAPNEVTPIPAVESKANDESVNIANGTETPTLPVTTTIEDLKNNNEAQIVPAKQSISNDTKSTILENKEENKSPFDDNFGDFDSVKEGPSSSALDVSTIQQKEHIIQPLTATEITPGEILDGGSNESVPSDRQEPASDRQEPASVKIDDFDAFGGFERVTENNEHAIIASISTDDDIGNNQHVERELLIHNSSVNEEQDSNPILAVATEAQESSNTDETVSYTADAKKVIPLPVRATKDDGFGDFNGTANDSLFVEGDDNKKEQESSPRKVLLVEGEGASVESFGHIGLMESNNLKREVSMPPDKVMSAVDLNTDDNNGSFGGLKNAAKEQHLDPSDNCDFGEFDDAMGDTISSGNTIGVSQRGDDNTPATDTDEFGAFGEVKSESVPSFHSAPLVKDTIDNYVNSVTDDTFSGFEMTKGKEPEPCSNNVSVVEGTFDNNAATGVDDGFGNADNKMETTDDDFGNFEDTTAKLESPTNDTPILEDNVDTKTGTTADDDFGFFEDTKVETEPSSSVAEVMEGGFEEANEELGALSNNCEVLENNDNIHLDTATQDDGFGDFTEVKDEPEQPSTNIAPVEEANDDFGDFEEVKDDAKSSQNNIAPVEKTNDDFGGFEEVKDDTKSSPNNAGSVEEVDDDFGDFGDFEDVKDESDSSVPVEDTGDDFGDFEEVKDEPKPAPSNTTAVEEDDDFGDFEEMKDEHEPVLAVEEDDDFGEFGEFDDGNGETQNTDVFEKNIDSVIQRLFGSFGCEGGTEGKDSSELNVYKPIFIKSILDTLQLEDDSVKTATMWSEKSVNVWLENREMLGNAPPQIIVNDDAAVINHSANNDGFGNIDIVTPFRSKRVVTNDASLSSNVLNTEPPLDTSITSIKENAAYISTGPAATIVSPPPIVPKVSDVSNTSDNSSGNAGPSKRGLPARVSSFSSFRKAVGGMLKGVAVEATKEEAQKGMKTQEEEVTPATDDFLAQIPDLSFMLQHKLCLPEVFKLDP